MKTVALIPIKFTSQRCPHKNILPIAGYPLCWHLCNTLNHVKRLDEVYVYSSEPAVQEYIPAEKKFLQRPARLGGDFVKGFDIYGEFIKTVDVDVYVLAHTTSPLIKVSSCQTALDNIFRWSV